MKADEIILETLVMIPLVWFILFLARKKLFPSDTTVVKRLKPVTPFVIAALAMGILGRSLLMQMNTDDMNNIGVFLFLILMSQTSSFLMILGCGNLAYNKGHHWGWGFLGTFSILGLLVVSLFKDRYKSENSKEKSNIEGPRRLALFLGSLGSFGWIIFVLIASAFFTDTGSESMTKLIIILLVGMLFFFAVPYSFVKGVVWVINGFKKKQ